MFATLPETGAKRKRSRWGGAASIAAHGAIVLLIVAARSDAHPPRPVPPAVDTTLIFSGGPERSGGGRPGGATPETRRPDELPLPPIGPVVPTTLDIGPSVDIDSRADVAGGVLGDIARGGGSRGGDALGGGGGSGFASEETVDEPVRVVTERPPRYPDALRAMGVAGTVVVRFVVDTAGRADLHSLQIVESPHEQFTTAVRTSLRDTRFQPGRIAGHPVKTLVQRSFRFAIEGER